MSAKKRWGMTKAEEKVWTLACQQARKHFDLKGTPGARISYAAGFYNCYFYLKRRGLLRSQRGTS